MIEGQNKPKKSKSVSSQSKKTKLASKAKLKFLADENENNKILNKSSKDKIAK